MFGKKFIKRTPIKNRAPIRRAYCEIQSKFLEKINKEPEIKTIKAKGALVIR